MPSDCPFKIAEVSQFWIKLVGPNTISVHLAFDFEKNPHISEFLWKQFYRVFPKEIERGLLDFSLSKIDV